MQTTEAHDLVVTMYRMLLEREPDEGGLELYTQELASGRLTAPDLAGMFATSDEFKSRRGLSVGLPRPAGCSRREAMEVFRQFVRYTGPGRPGYITNFLGGLTATRYVNLPRLGGHVEGYPFPSNFHAEALEWVGTLRAVLEAQSSTTPGSFTMIELGAGWAPWCTVGIIAAAQKGLASNVTAVEGDADHVDFIRTSFKENRHAPRNCRILHGIVGAQDGQAKFPRVGDASAAYGSAAQYGDAAPSPEMDTLPCFGLATLLKDHGRVDLIHCDVQGAEHDIFAAAMDVVTRKVRRVLIGTHSLALDRSLIKLFSGAGWECEGIETATMIETGEDSCLAGDGTQLWRNDRLA